MKGRGAAIIPTIGLLVYLGAILGTIWLAGYGLLTLVRMITG